MIWQREITPSIVNKRARGTYSEWLGLLFTTVNETSLVAEIELSARHMQPSGIMHGGVSCAIAETVASAAGQYCVEEGRHCLGLEINTNHIRSAREGDRLTAEASPIHLGRSTQVWNIAITNSVGKPISVTRLTLLVVASSG